MTKPLVTAKSIAGYSLWDKMKEKRAILSFNIELTARCNNNCRHCYINLPAGSREAQNKEVTCDEVLDIADQAIGMGALFCNITGGEPLLREDFKEIYIGLKKRGLLVTIYTNATLVRAEHIELFKRYPPRVIEVTVYGATRETYESVTRCPGSYQAFVQGLNLLLKSGMKVRLKAMALRSNQNEMPEIARYCRERTCDYFRFDPMLQLRIDHDPARNKEIRSERLSAQEIASLEKSDSERFQALEKGCDMLINPERNESGSNHLFHCGTGIGSFVLAHDGNLRLCLSLCHPDCVYDLRKGDLADAWHTLIPRVREMRSNNQRFLETCRICPIINLCMWCPANAYLEGGSLDSHLPYFCQVAHARAEALGYSGRDRMAE